MLIGLEGSVRREDGYWVGEWDTVPNYYWGTLLVFDQAPQPGDYERWTRLFSLAFAHRPGVQHFSFGWDDGSGAHGAVEPFRAAGYEVFDVKTLAAKTTRLPPRANTQVECRPLRGNAEWADLVGNELTRRPDGYDDAQWEHYIRGLVGSYRRSVEKGHGAWFGAFLQGELTATAGIFCVNGLARYQSVVTRPRWQKRGIAGRLIAEMGQWANHNLNAERLVITADEGSSAARIYASCGLEVVESNAGCMKRAPRDQK